MTIWVDAQLSPQLAAWITVHCGVAAFPLRELGLRDAEDELIFAEARKANAVVLTKDSDFVDLLHRHGPPPKVIWLTCGNTSNLRLQEILTLHFALAWQLLVSGEMLVEVSGS